MNMFFEIKPEMQLDTLHRLIWSNKDLDAVFMPYGEPVAHRMRYQWFTLDKVTGSKTERYYYTTDKGIFIEYEYKTYYRITELAMCAISADKLGLLNMVNLEDPTHYHNFLGYPMP